MYSRITETSTLVVVEVIWIPDFNKDEASDILAKLRGYWPYFQKWPIFMGKHWILQKTNVCVVTSYFIVRMYKVVLVLLRAVQIQHVNVVYFQHAFQMFHAACERWCCCLVFERPWEEVSDGGAIAISTPRTPITMCVYISYANTV